MIILEMKLLQQMTVTKHLSSRVPVKVIKLLSLHRVATCHLVWGAGGQGGGGRVGGNGGGGRGGGKRVERYGGIVR